MKDKQFWINKAVEVIGEYGTPVYASITGSHLYELPLRNHHDVDVRVMYLCPIERVFSMRQEAKARERMVETERGTLDVVGWEAAHFFRHLSKGNGTFVEIACSPKSWIDGEFVEEWDMKGLGGLFITRKLANHYHGYARGQLKRAGKQIESDKGIFYLYRELYSGLHILETGRIEYNWERLKDWVENRWGGYQSKVLPRFNERAGRSRLDDETLRAAWDEFDELTTLLNDVEAGSKLPSQDPSAPRAVDDYLQKLRWRQVEWYDRVGV